MEPGDFEEDDVELPDSLKPLGAVADQVLPPGVIDVTQQIGSHMPRQFVLDRIQRHFAHAGLGYRRRSEDTFKLKVRSRRYPLFGAFSGLLHIYPHVPFSNTPTMPIYKIEGALVFRPSAFWCVAVILFFALLAWLLKPGFAVSVGVVALGSAIAFFSSFQLGRAERDDAEERLEASFLLLRSTLQNIR